MQAKTPPCPLGWAHKYCRLGWQIVQERHHNHRDHKTKVQPMQRINIVETHIWVAIVARTSAGRTHYNFDIICWRPAHSLDLIVVLDDFNSSGTPLIRSNLDIYDNHIWNIYFMILIGLFGRKTFHRGWNSCRIHHRSCLNPFKDCFYPTGDFANINWYQCWWWY